MMDYKIFDGHNDVLFRLFLKKNPKSYLDFIEGDNEGHLDLPRIKLILKEAYVPYMFLLQNKIFLILINLLITKIWRKKNIHYHFQDR